MIVSLVIGDEDVLTKLIHVLVDQGFQLILDSTAQR
jgi:hypothetical protein